ncbi:MAG: type II secretion system minor pseudopilin GspH [Candidatus Competibacteraceae bacterium]|nr:type II secretion system minor pseudopilin GspH [Candidatus Competibacteraceae bacterium]
MVAPARGFTLLEIMVVLVLVGILSSFALLSVGGGPRDRLAEEAQRLAAVIELHQQEAILSGEPRGVQFTRAGYAILRQDEKRQWQPPAADSALIEHRLPEGLGLALWVEGRPAPLNRPDERAKPVPQVLLLASGEATEFVAVLGLADDREPDAPRYRVASDAMGRLTAGAATR